MRYAKGHVGSRTTVGVPVVIIEIQVGRFIPGERRTGWTDLHGGVFSSLVGDLQHTGYHWALGQRPRFYNAWVSP